MSATVPVLSDVTLIRTLVTVNLDAGRSENAADILVSYLNSANADTALAGLSVLREVASRFHVLELHDIEMRIR